MKNSKSKLIVVIISVFVGLLHFLIGPNYSGPLPEFVVGYLMDILLPMNLYLLFQLSFRNKTSVRSSRIFASLFTIVFAFWVEFLQFKGISILGNTFDKIDLVMYLLGVLLGLLIDLYLLEKLEVKIRN